MGQQTIFEVSRNRTYDLWIWSTVVLPTEMRDQTGASCGLRQVNVKGIPLHTWKTKQLVERHELVDSVGFDLEMPNSPTWRIYRDSASVYKNNEANT